MTHPEDIERKLGFDQVRQRIAGYCLGKPGEHQVAQIGFRPAFDEVAALLIQVSEARSILERGSDLPLQSYEDPQPWFETAAVEGNFIEAEQFSQLGKALAVILAAVSFLNENRENYPALFRLTSMATTAKEIPKMIADAVDDEGKMKDGASPGLARIRKALREEERKVRKVAEQIMRTALAQGWTPQGANPTVRDGRLVVPVLSEHKRRIRGYIIDESATGQTVYIEPGELLEANNDLRELELEERKEVIRILRDMTLVVRRNLPGLTLDFEFLSWLDFTRAKAKLSRDINAAMPVLEKEPCLKWRAARHPLLELSLRGKRPVVPLTIELLHEDRFLLVSGPNAGGKSVCLKTVGLLQYMLQCGLLIPVHPDSVAGIFEDIFLDMGDQQSIENDLSTYSSHLRNMDLFVRKAAGNSLVLMDELGSGTDPNFGGGIAQAVLQALVKKGAWGLATTHYYNLKAFASNMKGIRNAAMLFDADNLAPLFKLEIGQPGSSFALEIARKIGLPPRIIESAEQFIGEGLTGLETLMKKLQDEKQAIDEKQKEMSEREERLKAELQRYEQLTGLLETQKKDILNKAKSEASVLLQETNREIEKTIRHIRENKAEKKETRKVREGLKELQQKVKPVAVVSNISRSPLVAGDKVRIIGGDVTGTIMSLKGKTASVQFGDLRSSVSVDRLVRSDESSPARKSIARVEGVEFHRRQSEFSPLLDIRGKRVDEVLPLLTRFMDDAVLLSQAEVRILHGKGEGVLRKVAREFLKKLKSVDSFHDEHADRGGEGMTIVSLR